MTKTIISKNKRRIICEIADDQCPVRVEMRYLRWVSIVHVSCEAWSDVRLNPLERLVEDFDAEVILKASTLSLQKIERTL